MRLHVCQAPCLHFGSILGPFWVYFGSILGPFRGQFWVHFGVHYAYCLSGDASFNQHFHKNQCLDKNAL